MYSRTYRLLVTVPPLLWVIGFLLVPYGLLFCYSFWKVQGSVIVRQWGLDSYLGLVANPMYADVLMRSVRIAGAVTALSVGLGFVLAYTLSFHASWNRDLLYQFVILPLWVSYLVRAYAWKTILGSDGVLNTLLQYVHLVDGPIDSLLYSPFAVVLTLTHIYTPFAFLSIYAALEHIPRRLIEASQDLGASSSTTFWRIILPLALPGVLAGGTFAFVLSLGDFLAPLLLGGPSGLMISNVVVSLFGSAYDWPLGAAVSLCMLVLVMTLLGAMHRLEKRLDVEVSS